MLINSLDLEMEIIPHFIVIYFTFLPHLAIFSILFISVIGYFNAFSPPYLGHLIPHLLDCNPSMNLATRLMVFVSEMISLLPSAMEMCVIMTNEIFTSVTIFRKCVSYIAYIPNTRIQFQEYFKLRILTLIFNEQYRFLEYFCLCSWLLPYTIIISIVCIIMKHKEMGAIEVMIITTVAVVAAIAECIILQPPGKMNVESGKLLNQQKCKQTLSLSLNKNLKWVSRMRRSCKPLGIQIGSISVVKTKTLIVILGFIVESIASTLILLD